MERANWHTYQVLTKRSPGCGTCSSGRLRFAADLAHIWWGVSVEDRNHGLPRIDHLRQAPAAVRFLSIEPLLEDLGRGQPRWNPLGHRRRRKRAGARPMQKEWVLSIRDQCGEANVPVLLQAVGRRAQEQEMAALDGRDLRRIPSTSCLADSRERKLPGVRSRCRRFLPENRRRIVVGSDYRLDLSSPKSGSASMKHFRLPLVLCWLTLLAAAQNPGGWLSDLPQAKDYVQKRSSSYDRTGGNAEPSDRARRDADRARRIRPRDDHPHLVHHRRATSRIT